MEHEEIIKKVRSILNELGGDDTVGIVTDRVLLDDYIESAIPDAVIVLANKGYRVNVKTKTGVDLKDSVVADEGFVSLIKIKGRQWKREVTKLTPLDSTEYIMAQNEFTAPGIHSPIAFWLEDDIYAIPSDSSATIMFNAVYDKTVGLNAETKEAMAVCYMTAAIVMGIFENDNAKQRLSDISIGMLQ